MHKFHNDKYMYYDYDAHVFRGPGVLRRGEFHAASIYSGVTFVVPIEHTREVLTIIEYTVCPRGPGEDDKTYKARWVPPEKEEYLKAWQTHVALVRGREPQHESGWSRWEDPDEDEVEGDEEQESRDNECDSESTRDQYDDEEEPDDEQKDGESKKEVVDPLAGERREALELKDKATKQAASGCMK